MTPNKPTAELNGPLGLSNPPTAYNELAVEPVPSYAGPAAPPRANFSAGAVWRFKWTFVLVALPFFVAGPLAAYFGVKPEYEATSTILVSPTQGHILYRSEDDSRPKFFQQYLKSQVGLIESPTILNRVLADTRVQQTAWFRQPAPGVLSPPKSDLERLNEALDVSVMPGSFLIAITARVGSARDAVVLANVVQEEFLKYSAEAVGADSQVVFSTLTPEEQKLRGSIDDRARRGGETLMQLRVTTPEHLVTTRGARIEQMRGSLQDLERQIDVLKQQRDQLLADEAAAGGSDHVDDAAQLFAADREWVQRRTDLEDARRQLEDAQARFGPQHPTVQSLAKRVRSVETLLSERESFLRVNQALRAVPTAGDDGGSLAPASLTQTINQKEFEAQRLRADLQKEEDAFQQDFQRALELARDNESLARDKQKYGMIRQRLDELQLEGALASIREAAKAAPPTWPSNWKQPILVCVGLVLLGTGCGFVAANRRAALRPVAQDFARVTHAPILGMLPRIRSDRPMAPREAQVQAERIRIVRAGILHRLQADRGGTIVVTSAGPGAGKTTVAIMLARSLAQGGKRVLLVDTDLRRPNVAKAMGIKPQLGLNHLLSGAARDEEVILAADTPGLNIIPIGPGVEVQHIELLANGVFGICLKRWREAADFVILDTCPVLPVADARMLFRHADGVLLVAREGRCRQSELAETLSCVENAGGRLLGTVFVGTRGSSAYGDSYYGYGG